jgi:ribosomal-protein-alanine N-acetyltransferase
MRRLPPALFHAYTHDPEVTRYLTWRPNETVADTERFLSICVQAWHGESDRAWIITRADDGAPIGMLDLRLDEHRAGMGYVLARAEWGKGYMTEAVQAVVALALAEPTVYRVWAVCDVENVASARVLEKVGLLREGTLRRYILHPNVSAEPRDVHLCARTR